MVPVRPAVIKMTVTATENTRKMVAKSGYPFNLPECHEMSGFLNLHAFDTVTIANNVNANVAKAIIVSKSICSPGMFEIGVM